MWAAGNINFGWYYMVKILLTCHLSYTRSYIDGGGNSTPIVFPIKIDRDHVLKPSCSSEVNVIRGRVYPSGRLPWLINNQIRPFREQGAAVKQPFELYRINQLAQLWALTRPSISRVLYFDVEYTLALFHSELRLFYDRGRHIQIWVLQVALSSRDSRKSAKVLYSEDRNSSLF